MEPKGQHQLTTPKITQPKPVKYKKKNILENVGINLTDQSKQETVNSNKSKARPFINPNTNKIVSSSFVSPSHNKFSKNNMNTLGTKRKENPLVSHFKLPPLQLEKIKNFPVSKNGQHPNSERGNYN